MLNLENCPFCGKTFDPIWDCKIASCWHVYHSWRACAHFSTSTKCLVGECGLEMHGD